MVVKRAAVAAVKPVAVAVVATVAGVGVAVVPAGCLRAPGVVTGAGVVAGVVARVVAGVVVAGVVDRSCRAGAEAVGPVACRPHA